MSQSRTLFSGMDVHTDAMAVADVAQEHGAAVLSLGTIGTRQCDMDPRLRQRPSKATPLVLVSDAGPCGAWHYRALRTKDAAGWVVAPSLLPKKAGARVQTDRRDAMPRARLARSGERTAVSVPTGADDAMRALRRARAETLGDGRPPRSVSPPAYSDTIAATRAGPPGAPPLAGGARQSWVKHQRTTSSCKPRSVP